MAGNVDDLSVDDIEKLELRRTETKQASIIAEGRAKMVEAAHELAVELGQEFRRRLVEVLDRINGETREELKVESQRYVTELQERINQNARGNDLSTLCDAVLREYLEPAEHEAAENKAAGAASPPPNDPSGVPSWWSSSNSVGGSDFDDDI